MRQLKPQSGSGRMTGQGIAMLGIAAFAVAIAASTPSASAETRTLKLYYLHTGEKTTVTFKKDGKYLPDGLKKANWALRDWRRNEPTKMDPRLLDLVWEAYQRSGSKDYIHVISGYRAPETNSMLRQRGRGVAKNSQHMLGRAMDFFLPDVKLSKVREIGLKMEVGGVGYYPTSGSPFVHLDVGNVRHWPRMSRTELARVFPDGKTIHIPSDGKPLPGYEQALASYKARKARAGDTQIATADDVKKPGFFASLMRKQKEDQQDDEESNTATLPRAVKTTAAPAETVIASASPEQIAPASSRSDGGPVPPASVEPQVALAIPEGSRVPVPTAAPRNRQAASQGIVLATATPTEPATDTLDSAAPGDDPSQELVELASLPIPRPRPNRSVEAMALANALNREQGQQVAMLSADEIENLRNSAVPGPALAPSTIPAIRPTNALALGENTDPVASSAGTAIENLVTPSQRPAKADNVPAPGLKPYHGPDARTLALALAPTDETRTSASEAIRTLIEKGEVVSSISAVPASTHRKHKDAGNAMAADSKAPVSINDAPVGRLALAANRKLGTVNEISPPAFGVLAFEKGAAVTTGKGFVKTSSLYPIGKLIRATN
ncbi:MAG: DUF882 domain-containing protein [Nitratireductor sp.]|nr:DUF882 domain-containing protein [Nitratireductor sp.]MCB1456975.1 DUF882 domain-containing protein [Nitratireductor sp.]